MRRVGPLALFDGGRNFGSVSVWNEKRPPADGVWEGWIRVSAGCAKSASFRRSPVAAF